MNFSDAQLRSFLAVAELSSFTAAAKALSLSQPALSRSIKALESAVGARLFDRHTRRLSLTPTGVELHRIAARIAAEKQRGIADLKDFLSARRGSVTIAILPSAARLLSRPTIKLFEADSPDVLLRLRDGSQEPLLADVLQGRADFAVAMNPHRDELHFQPLLDDEFVFLGHPDAVRGRSGAMPWSTFSDKPFIALAEGSSIRRMTDAAFRQIDLTVSLRHECGHPASAIALAAVGLGVTALPRLTLPPLLGPDLAARPLNRPLASRSIGIITRTDRALSPAASRLARILLETVPEKSDEPRPIRRR